MTPEQAAELRKEFPASAIGKLPKPYSKDSAKGNCQECGGYHGLPAAHLDYVGHAAATDRLLSVDPDWSWEPFARDEDGCPRVRNNGKELEMWIRLTVCGVTKPGVGTCPPGTFESAKQLVSDALRNGALRFGVAIDLWAKEDLHDIQNPPPPPPEPATSHQTRTIASRIAALSDEQSQTLRDWWKSERIPKAEKLNEDDAERVIAKLDEIEPEAF